MQPTSPIGVFDSGIGGLTVASAISALLPNENILYFGDTLRCPYGDKQPADVVQFSCQVVDFLVEQGVKMVVVACNTATAVALQTLVKRYSVPVIGVISPGSRAALLDHTASRIGVIGTAVTVQTGAYETTIRRLNPHVEVFSLACPRFVPMVEQGLTDGPEIEEVVRASLAPLQALDLDSLILGCTHYPLLEGVIRKVMGPNVRLISSAEETAREVADWLTNHQLLHSSRNDRPLYGFFTSGESIHMQRVARRWQLALSSKMQSVREVSVMLPPRAIYSE